MTTDRKKLQGVWESVEVTTTGPNAATYPAQPGLFIFTGNHHSQTTVNGNAPRKRPADQAKATADELRELLRFTANAGTYEIKGGDLLRHPAVALSALNMAPGVTVTSSYNLEGDTLWMTLKSNYNGPVANPATTKLRRVQ